MSIMNVCTVEMHKLNIRMREFCFNKEVDFAFRRIFDISQIVFPQRHDAMPYFGVAQFEKVSFFNI